jgi:hypothetical protein
MRNESDKNEEAARESGRKPELGLTRGDAEARNGESVLAGEFAQRALAPLITDLRGRSGRLDARRIASAIGLTVPELADCLELPEEALQQNPPSEGLDERLEPFAMVVGVVRDVYGGDAKRVRTWLRTPRPELEGQTPIDVMCVPSGMQRVINFVLNAWLRNAD